MNWNIYLSGEIHTDWRQQIIAGCETLGLSIQFTSAVTDHGASDDVGDLLGHEEQAFWKDHKSAKIGDSQTLLQVALSNKIELSHTCEGMGSCTTCRVFVLQGEMSERTMVEQERAGERNFQDNERLACQLKPVDGMVVKIP